MNIFTEAAKLEEQNCPFAMAQIVDSRGSTPRHSAQMLVRADGSIVGTIGGGMVERKVIEESLQALQERKPRLFHGRMARNGADAVGSDCGGAMSVFISVHGMRPRLVLIGAGHVNRAIAQSAALLGFDIAVADIYRESLNPELFPPSTTLLHAESFGAAVEALDIRPDNFVLIATNNLFSSRRRHTRCLSDWSSDVCSSDLYESYRYAGRPVYLRRSGCKSSRKTGNFSF